MNKRPRYRILASLLLAALQPLCAQPGGSPVFAHFSVQDGIPDRTVYHIIQDRQDYLWLATDQGICRFDGYEFWQPPGPEETTASAFNLSEDAQGRIWFQKLNGSLWYFERDSIRPWRFNESIAQYQGRFSLPGGYIFSETEGKAWVSLNDLGILEVGRAGHDTLLYPAELEASLILFVDKGQVLTSFHFNRSASDKTKKEVEKNGGFPVWQYENGFWRPVEGFSLAPAGYTATGLYGDTILLYKKNDGYYAIHSGQILWHAPYQTGTFNKLNYTPSGQLFAGVWGDEKGVLHYQDIDALRRGVYTRYLHGYSVTAACPDRAGGLWFSTHEDGIFYVANLKTRVWDTRHGLRHPMLRNLAAGTGGDLYLGLRNGPIQCFNRYSGYLTDLPRHPELVFSSDMVYDPLHQRLFASTPMLFYFQKGAWKNIPVPIITRLSKAAATKISFSRDKQQVFCASPTNFHLLENETIPRQTTPYNPAFKERCLTLHEDPLGRRWLSAYYGLYLLRNTRPVSMRHLHPLFEKKGPACITDFSDTLLAFGFQNKGILLWGPDSQFVHIGPAQGLPSGTLNHLCDDGKGHLWAGMTKGLSKIYRNAQGQWAVRTYTTAHGLPDAQIDDIVPDSAGYLWLATAKGLCRFQEPDILPQQPKPFLSQLVVNGTNTDFTTQQSFSHDQNNLKINFLTLNFRQFGYIEYRYRLLENDAWNYTKNRTVELANLTPGAFHFEVQSLDEEGRWSKSCRWNFIVQPPWWATWWFRGLALLSLATVGYFWFRSRLRQVEERAVFQQQINALERSALQAQMNPHFIFNTLNSIQNFILQNDKVQAVDYLARFAKFIRLVLEASVLGKVTLADEVAALEHYLSLEKLRFKEKMRYEIGISADIDAETTLIPPLLIQPFVENALVHGLKGKESGGVVEVFFSIEGDSLLVKIRDNGSGPAQANGNMQHRSIGTNITQKRLDMLLKPTNVKTIIYHTRTDEAGVAIGTEVEVRVGLNAAL